jgi:hypothetical protein
VSGELADGGRLSREPPRVNALLHLLNEQGVRYLVTGSVAAMLHGVALEPGDLDITSALDRDNLVRLARVLEMIDAQQDPHAPFGDWEVGVDGEQRWVEREPTPEDIAARASWKPQPGDPSSFDHLLQSRYGAIDIVPRVSGSYDELMPQAVRVDVDGHAVWIEAIADLLATLTIPRRSKDRDRVEQLRALQGTLRKGSSSVAR